MSGKKVLVIGSGGREHALTWALSKSPSVDAIYCAPGNGGMSQLATLVSLDVKDHNAVLQFTKDNNIDLTVIGPEAPLVDGLSDTLQKAGQRVLGASQQAAQLEGSKNFAKLFMERHDIPTAGFRSFSSADEAKQFAQSPEGKNFKILKADGLAAGKGVFVNKNTNEVLKAIETVMVEKKFGAAGENIILEETLEGPEVSVIALTDGKTILPFTASQDHKRAYDNDEGPNTGGMGAYAPTPFYTESLRKEINTHVVERFLTGLKNDNLDFRGFIYFGLMLTKQGPKVLEFNVRFGDPEAQVALPLIETDFYGLCAAAADGKLATAHLSHKQGFACTVVMASGGYPGAYEKGMEISGLDEVESKTNVEVFHAGTKNTDKAFVTTGGRVLNVTGFGKTLDEAVVHAYQAVKKIGFKNSFFRNDIAAKALKNKNLTNRIKKMKKRYAKKLKANA